MQETSLRNDLTHTVRDVCVRVRVCLCADVKHPESSRTETANFLIPNQYESILLGCANMESESLGIQREQHRIRATLPVTRDGDAAQKSWKNEQDYSFHVRCNPMSRGRGKLDMHTVELILVSS